MRLQSILVVPCTFVAFLLLLQIADIQSYQRHSIGVTELWLVMVEFGWPNRTQRRVVHCYSVRVHIRWVMSPLGCAQSHSLRLSDVRIVDRPTYNQFEFGHLMIHTEPLKMVRVERNVKNFRGVLLLVVEVMEDYSRHLSDILLPPMHNPFNPTNAAVGTICYITYSADWARKPYNCFTASHLVHVHGILAPHLADPEMLQFLACRNQDIYAGGVCALAGEAVFPVVCQNYIFGWTKWSLKVDKEKKPPSVNISDDIFDVIMQVHLDNCLPHTNFNGATLYTISTTLIHTLILFNLFCTLRSI